MVLQPYRNSAKSAELHIIFETTEHNNTQAIYAYIVQFESCYMIQQIIVFTRTTSHISSTHGILTPMTASCQTNNCNVTACAGSKHTHAAGASLSFPKWHDQAPVSNLFHAAKSEASYSFRSRR